MIKGKLIALLLSGLLAIGTGGLLIKSNNDKINNETKINETKFDDESSNNIVSNKDNQNENIKKDNGNQNNMENNPIEENNIENNIENNDNENNIENNDAENNTSTDSNPNNGKTPSIEDRNEVPNNSTDKNIPSSEDTSGPNNVITPEKDLTDPSDDNNLSKPSTFDNYISEVEQAIFQRVNQERSKAGLPTLSYNNTMEHYARLKSKDMGDRNYFDHANPEGKLITEQMKADGVTYNAWGENIAYISGMSSNAQLATQFMDNWMNSEGHRANILSSKFSSIGVGVYKIGNTYYATQEFYK